MGRLLCSTMGLIKKEEIICLLPPTTFISYFNKMNSVHPMKIKYMKFAMNDHYIEIKFDQTVGPLTPTIHR